MTNEEIAAFLVRIGYAGPTTPTAATLADIHVAFVLTVPFENLDIIPLGRRLVLTEVAIFDKIVRRRRGGYCYELNGLLGALLRGLGYGVSLVSVQFVEETGALSPPFDHCALVVESHDVAHPWLVDVAGGRNGFFRPLPLVDRFEETQPEVRRGFRLTNKRDRWRLDERAEEEEWKPEYAFEPIPRTLADFADRSRFMKRTPSHTFARVASARSPLGRVGSPSRRTNS